MRFYAHFVSKYWSSWDPLGSQLSISSLIGNLHLLRKNVKKELRFVRSTIKSQCYWRSQHELIKLLWIQMISCYTSMPFVHFKTRLICSVFISPMRWSWYNVRKMLKPLYPVKVFAMSKTFGNSVQWLKGRSIDAHRWPIFPPLNVEILPIL